MRRGLGLYWRCTEGAARARAARLRGQGVYRKVRSTVYGVREAVNFHFFDRFPILSPAWNGAYLITDRANSSPASY